MIDAIAKYDFIIGGTLRVLFYRTVHMVGLPFNISEVLSYAKANEAGSGQFAGHVGPVRDGKVLSVHQWEGIRVGDGIFMDAWIVGLTHGPQTWFIRKAFWKGNFSQRSMTSVPNGLLDHLRALRGAV